MVERNDFYTYAFMRKDGTPYYIGKGRDRRWKRGHNVFVPPVERVLFLKTGLVEEDAFRHEIYMIAVLGRKDVGTGILRNITDGGEGLSGYVFSDESKAKISSALTGRLYPERGQKISVALTGRAAWNKGLVGDPRCAGPPPSQKGKKWWKNLKLNENVMAFECPGDGWELGRIGWSKRNG